LANPQSSKAKVRHIQVVNLSDGSGGGGPFRHRWLEQAHAHVQAQPQQPRWWLLLLRLHRPTHELPIPVFSTCDSHKATTVEQEYVQKRKIKRLSLEFPILISQFSFQAVRVLFKFSEKVYYLPFSKLFWTFFSKSGSHCTKTVSLRGNFFTSAGQAAQPLSHEATKVHLSTKYSRHQEQLYHFGRRCRRQDCQEATSFTDR